MPAVTNASVLSTRFGEITVVTQGNRVVRVVLPGHDAPLAAPSDASERAATHIAQYLSHSRTQWNLDIAVPAGTPFQLAVWRALTAIPFGETRTYGQIAKAIGHPRAARAVGTACALNPVPLLVPCHRVVPAGGGVGNYAGGTAMKAALLGMEREVIAHAS